MQRQTVLFFSGIFLGYALVQAVKLLNSNLLWIFFYRH